MDIGIDASRAFLNEPTGTEEYSLQLIRSLGKIDPRNSYTLYVRQFPSPDSALKLPPNFKIKPLLWPRLWTQAGLALECLKSPPDVLFIPAHTMPILRRPGLKTVVTIHDLGAEFLPQYHQFPQKFYLNKATEYAVGHATHLIAVSESTKKDLISKLHCDTEKISVIYEGYDREKFKVQPFGSFGWTQDKSAQGESSKFKVAKIRKKYGIDGDYILFVGTIQPRKNLTRLVEAFAKIHDYSLSDPSADGESKGNIKVGLPFDELPLKARLARLAARQAKGGRVNCSGSNKGLSLLIVGKPGWMAEEIYAAPEKFGVADKVKFLNYVPKEDLPLFYQNALCFILPSLYEGFGLPVLEAMACGCPVIASKRSSLPELVGAAGLLVDPYDIDDIAKNLQLLTSDLQLKKTLIEKGLEQVKKFSWEKCARETMKVLGKI